VKLKFSIAKSCYSKINDGSVTIGSDLASSKLQHGVLYKLVVGDIVRVLAVASCANILGF
jgi:hypothetical protein